jgi:hypothetical protein
MISTVLLLLNAMLPFLIICWHHESHCQKDPESIVGRYGSMDPDPYQNETDAEHC